MFDPQKVPRIHIEMISKQACGIFPFLQRGFYVQTTLGKSIVDTLDDQFGIRPEYFEERIKTLFLNGHPVDDAKTAILRDQDALAMSAAMPGLVGAVLRRGGCLAPFRAAISHRGGSKTTDQADGAVQIKLFNLLVKELGPAFLQRGIYIGGEIFDEFIELQSDLFWKQCSAIRYNETPQEKESLKASISAEKPAWVWLKVTGQTAD
jgi:hypothetical protein